MPTCTHCDRPLSPRATTCPGCGHPGPGAGQALATAVASVNRTDGYAIASIVCATSAFFGTFIFGSVLGIVFGRMARTRLAADPGREGEGLAQTGIILGWVGVALGVVFLLLGMAAFASVTRETGFMRFGF